MSTYNQFVPHKHPAPQVIHHGIPSITRLDSTNYSNITKYIPMISTILGIGALCTSFWVIKREQRKEKQRLARK